VARYLLTSALLLAYASGMVLAVSKYHTSENDSKLRCPRGGSVRLVVSVVSVVAKVQRLTRCNGQAACHTKYGLLA